MLVEALSAAANTGGHSLGYDDLDELAGRWIDDPEFEEAISVHDRVDHSLWS